MSELKLCKDCIDEPFCGFPHTGNSLGCDYWIKEDVDAQAVDAVHVVRCRECRHAVKIGEYGCYCRNNSTPWFNGEFEVYMDQDDFCSYGERKEGAD